MRVLHVGVIALVLVLVGGQAQGGSLSTSKSEKRVGGKTVFSRLQQIKVLAGRRQNAPDSWSGAIDEFNQAVERAIKKMPSWGPKKLSKSNRGLISHAEEFLREMVAGKETKPQCEQILKALEPKKTDSSATKGIKAALQIAIYEYGMLRGFALGGAGGIRAIKLYKDMVGKGADKLDRIIAGAD
ncbi:MAG: hypothetical protein M1549_01665 [Candidatus Dependentiae bacterium]|nr:hypothetical protein [Candidatus Dependentiae bacterium]